MPEHSDLGLLVLPEAVCLAEALCDLDWRRYVAMVELNFDLTQFYDHVAHRLGQPRMFARSIAWNRDGDPLRRWVMAHCGRHKQTRNQYWDRVRRHQLPLVHSGR
ncbi:hypothetical protein [Nocardia sp. NPDC004604]|uniref:hypothetical protein n=1 Tax=Nocardia sp. NPDC004604 TaxID=3157013 RepID=UPI0033A6C656